jgi:beta-glucosidase
MPLYGGLPKASQLNSLLEPDVFLWATGIEDTFIIEPSKRTGRILDEYELTGHYERWKEDIDLMASLGVRCARYGIPWYRVQPTPGTWDWTWPDQTFERMLERGVEPIVDLVHYGVPHWLNNGLLDVEFPSRMAEYAARVADRFKGQLRWYTPLNEPRISAWYAGMLGWWPPHKRGWKGFSKILLNISRAVCLTHRALKEVDPEITCVHVDPADLYLTNDPSLKEEVDLRQQVVFLALDLITGRVDTNHALWDWLMQMGHQHNDVERFLAISVQPDIIGINCYPLFGQKEMLRSGSRIVTRNRYGDGGLLENLVAQYWQRYGKPIMITETASLGKKRLEWMDQSVAAVRHLRANRVPVVGYTWWPMFSIASWGYQHGNKDLQDYMVHLGMWDLDSKLNRIETPIAQSYRKLVELGSNAVGELNMSRKEVTDFALR